MMKGSEREAINQPNTIEGFFTSPRSPYVFFRKAEII